MTRTTNTDLIDRRTALAGLGTFGLGAAMLHAFDDSLLQAGQSPSMAPLNRFPRMVHEFFVDQVGRASRRRLKVIEQLQTEEDAKAYVELVRSKIASSFGPFPERTPLNTQVRSTVERDEYTIENITFESRPGFLVTANLYLPKKGAFPAPAVVGTCGHSSNGKAAEAYQSFAQGLARQGYVVLLYDPIGQGERLQYPDEQLKSTVGVGVREHLYAGNQQFLVGEFIGAWRAWDGIRALDCLLERKEVDPNQIGVTGNSGGGTMTTWLCGVERRWKMAAPSCFVTEFRRNLENELPADTEQCPPRALALGLDHEDFIAAMAPNPVILLAKEKDFFDVRGTEQAYERLKKIYRLLGAEENIALFVGPTTHGYSQENREAMYGWFNGVTKVADGASEPELTIESDETLWCTPHGQVVEIGSRPVSAYTRERSIELRGRRKLLEKGPLQRAVRQALKLPDVELATPDYRILRPYRSRQYPVANATAYAVQTEPGVHSVVYRLFEERTFSRPHGDQPLAILYVAHHSSDDELRNEAMLKDLLADNPSAACYACDVRGIGESKPNTCSENSFLDPYGSDYFYAIHGIMLDRPYVGQKSRDLLAVLKWLQSLGHSDVHLVGNGWGSVPAAFAAVLSDLVTRVTLKDHLESYAHIAESETYDWPLSSFVPSVLKRFDLTDVYRVLKEKQIEYV